MFLSGCNIADPYWLRALDLRVEDVSDGARKLVCSDITLCRDESYKLVANEENAFMLSLSIIDPL